jgi:ParB family chromosome partitioning protein
MIPAPAAANRGMLEIDLALIVPHQNNPRKTFDQDALQELAESIRTHGILQPLVVRKEGPAYEIIAGERRYRAAQLAGLARVPVVVREEADERQLAELRLIENIQRADLNPIEIAEAYKTLLEEHGLTQEDLAQRLGKDRSSVSNSIRLLTLPSGVRRLVADGRLSMGHARCLVTVDDDELRQDLAQRVQAEGWSVRTLEQQVRQRASQSGEAAPRQSRGKRSKPPHIKELEENLLRLFGRPVEVTERGGKGTMAVHFHTKGDFKRMIDVTDRMLQELGQVE